MNTSNSGPEKLQLAFKEDSKEEALTEVEIKDCRRQILNTAWRGN